MLRLLLQLLYTRIGKQLCPLLLHVMLLVTGYIGVNVNMREKIHVTNLICILSSPPSSPCPPSVLQPSSPLPPFFLTLQGSRLWLHLLKSSDLYNTICPDTGVSYFQSHDFSLWSRTCCLMQRLTEQRSLWCTQTFQVTTTSTCERPHALTSFPVHMEMRLITSAFEAIIEHVPAYPPLVVTTAVTSWSRSLSTSSTQEVSASAMIPRSLSLVCWVPLCRLLTVYHSSDKGTRKLHLRFLWTKTM